MKRSIKFVAIALVLLAASPRPAVSDELSARQDRTTDFIQLLAAPQGQRPLFVASTDPKQDNEDYLTLKPGESRTISLPQGSLVRLWSTALEPDKIDLTLAGVTAPGGGAKSISVLQQGQAGAGTYENKTYLWYPWKYQGLAAARKLVGAVLGHKAGLIVRNASKQPNKWFYQATIRPGISWPPAIAMTQTIQRGQPKLLVEAKAGAVVKTLSIRFKSKPDAVALQGIRLLVSLRPKAAGTPIEVIDVPLGPLVGSFQSDAGSFRDAMTEWDGQNLTLRWPMPFDGAKQQFSVEVAGAPAEIEATVAALPTAVLYRFHAASRSQRTVRKQPLPILKLTGEGVFVGLRMSAAPSKESGRRAFAYLEGNESLIADGVTYEGTGTEDFFNSAWYFPEKPFQRPYGGLTERSALPPAVSMYRLMIPDALPFKRDFTFEFEVGRKNNSDDMEYRWVAFWYQKERGTVAIEDELSGGAGDSAVNPFASLHVDNSPKNVKDLPNMPVWVEIAVGVALLVAVGLSLSAVFRKK